MRISILHTLPNWSAQNLYWSTLPIAVYSPGYFLTALPTFITRPINMIMLSSYLWFSWDFSLCLVISYDYFYFIYFLFILNSNHSSCMCQASCTPPTKLHPFSFILFFSFLIFGSHCDFCFNVGPYLSTYLNMELGLVMNLVLSFAYKYTKSRTIRLDWTFTVRENFTGWPNLIKFIHSQIWTGSRLSIWDRYSYGLNTKMSYETAILVSVETSIMLC